MAWGLHALKLRAINEKGEFNALKSIQSGARTRGAPLRLLTETF